MEREYHVYKVDIWAFVVGEELPKMMNSRLLTAHIYTRLANCCCPMNLAYFAVSHFSLPH